MAHGDNYYLGQGKLFIARRDSNGKAQVLRWLGDASDAAVSLKTDTIKPKENYSGQRLTAKVIVVGKEGTFDYTLLDYSQENVALALYGQPITVESGAISGEILPTVAAGDRVALKYMDVSNVVIVDSSNVPAVLDDAKYVVDPEYGTLTFNDVAGMTQPFSVAYQHGDIASVAMFSSAPEELFFRFEGINTADGAEPLVVELYRVSTEPLKKLDLIGTKLAEMQMSSTVLIDSAKQADNTIGQFGRFMTKSK